VNNKLQQFHCEVYQNFSNYKRTDTLMDLVDALSSNTTAKSEVELTLNPQFRRTYTALNKAIMVECLSDKQIARGGENNRSATSSEILFDRHRCHTGSSHYENLLLAPNDGREISVTFSSNIRDNTRLKLVEAEIIRLYVELEKRAWERTLQSNGCTAYFVRDIGVGFDLIRADRGLAAVQRIVRHHGGMVWVQSSAGKGAVFNFTIGDC